MGYRSDVVCLMYGKNTQEDTTIVKEFIRQRVTPELFKFFSFDGWGAVFTANQWKWYEGYEDIDMLNRMFEEFREELCTDGWNSGYAFEFVRVGESLDDIEALSAGSNEGRLDVKREITFTT
jgi:hypothetical protein